MEKEISISEKGIFPIIVYADSEQYKGPLRQEAIAILNRTLFRNGISIDDVISIETISDETNVIENSDEVTSLRRLELCAYVKMNAETYHKYISFLGSKYAFIKGKDKENNDELH